MDQPASTLAIDFAPGYDTTTGSSRNSNAPALSDFSAVASDCDTNISSLPTTITSVPTSPSLVPVADGGVLQQHDQEGVLAGVGGIISGANVQKRPAQLPNTSKHRKGPGKVLKERERWRAHLVRKLQWWIKYPPKSATPPPVANRHPADYDQPLRYCRASATYPFVASSRGILGWIRYWAYAVYWQQHFDDFEQYRASLPEVMYAAYFESQQDFDLYKTDLMKAISKQIRDPEDHMRRIVHKVGLKRRNTQGTFGNQASDDTY